MLWQLRIASLRKTTDGSRILNTFPSISALIAFGFFLLTLSPVNLFSSEVSMQATLDPAVQLISSSSSGTEFRFTLPEINHRIETLGDREIDHYSIESESFARYSDIEDGGQLIHELPVISRMFLIPPQSGVEVQVSDIVSRIERNVTLDGIAPNRDDESAFTDDGFYPREIVSLGEPGIMRGYRLVNVIINPLQWNPETRELRVMESADIKLNFDTALNRVNIINNPDRPRPSRNIQRIVRNLVVDPEPAWETPSRDEPSGGSILYVTMDSDAVLAEVARLLEWRRKMGWTAEVIVVNDNENRNAIKRDIQAAYDDWDIPPEFIVLVGDAPGLEGNDYTLAYYNEQAGGRSAYETDHHYCELEGNDLLPEAAIGRLVFSNITMLRTQVDKIIGYESDPYLPGENRSGWQQRAIVAATDYRSGTSSIDICNWFKNVALDHGFTSVNEFYWSNDEQTPNPTDFLNDNITRGVSFVLYRGWSRMNGYETRDVTDLRNGRMLPFVLLATCNTGDYGENLIDPAWSYTERFLWAANGGAIGAVGAAGPTHTAYNNLLATSALRAIFGDEIYPQGWATMAGKLALYSHYADRGDIQHSENRGMEAWLTLFYIYNLMGDPAVDLYTAMPERLSVDHAETLVHGDSYFEVIVNYDERDAPAEDVQVCLYKPESFQLIERTDANGMVAFHIDPEWMDEGTVYLTVTGPNLFPYRAEFEIRQAGSYLGALGFAVDDDNNGESRGDGDNIANPLERIELNVAFTNFGNQRPDGGLTLELTSMNPQISVILDEVELNNAPNPGQIRSVNFVIDIAGSAVNGSICLLQLDIHGANQSWSSSIEVPIEGPQLEYEWLDWNDDELMPGDTSTAYITISNSGTKPSPPVVGRLQSRTGTINVLNNEVTFGVIQPRGVAEANELVRLSAHKYHMPGTSAEFALILESDNGFRNTTEFSFTVDRVRDGQPFGPDDYGYICIDNTDTSWASYPRYDWIELHEDENARNTGLRDTGEQRDQSVTVDMPFDFTYYGERFDQVTICTNGWMAFGDHGEVNSARNRRIPSGEVSSAMLCPFWDELITPFDTSAIYWKHDEAENLFIVEWYNLRKLGPQGWNEPIETFEIILYNPNHYPTRTGDGDIVFQYKRVRDDRSAYQNWDTPWATVGIGSPDLTTGLEYTYWGVRHAGAAVLEPGRAIKFTTTIQFQTAMLSGTVTDALTGETLAGAVITTSYDTGTMSDEDGNYEIHDMIVADDYQIKASCQFYNDSTRSGISVDIDGENVQNFALLHPVFEVSPNELQIEAIYVDSAVSTLIIENSGNGVLTYKSRRVEPGHNQDDEWELIWDWPITEMTGSSNIQGIVYCDGYWIVAGGRQREGEKWLYRLRYDGLYIDRMPQPDDSSNGIRDMDYYDGAIYAVQSSRELLKINPEDGSVLRRWALPEQLEFARAIALDPDNRRIFLSGTMFGIYEMAFNEDSSLVWTTRHDLADPRSMNVLKPYGMSWFKDDLDGFNLYLYTKEDPLDDDNLPDISIFRVAPKSCQVEYLTSLPELNPTISGRGGICITPFWNDRNWVMAAVLDDPNADRIGIFNLAPNFSWIQYSPREMIISAGQTSEMTLTVYTEFVKSGDYLMDLEFLHNARPGITTVPVRISVTVDAPESEEPVTPAEYALHQNWPNPFNPETTISYYIPIRGQVNLSIYDTNGRELFELVNGIQSEGEQQVKFDASDLATGVYFYRLHSGNFCGIRKMVLVR